MSVFTGGYGATVCENRDRIYCALMQAQHLFGGIAPEQPPDRRCIEATRERRGAVGRDRQPAYRTAMPAQLRLGWRNSEH
jgi:hypothetical protein